MERFDIASYLKEKYNINQYPFDANANLPLSVDKLDAMLDEIHRHYCNEKDNEASYEGPELVNEKYAEVVSLHNEVGELGAVLRQLEKLIGSRKHIIGYIDRGGVACYSVGGELDVKEMLYINYILNQQVGVTFTRSNIPQV